MSFGVNLIARLVVVTTLINYSLGDTADLLATTAPNTTVASSRDLVAMSKAQGSEGSRASVMDFLEDNDEFDPSSSGSVSDISTAGSSTYSFTDVYSTESPAAETSVETASTPTPSPDPASSVETASSTTPSPDPASSVETASTTTPSPVPSSESETAVTSTPSPEFTSATERASTQTTLASTSVTTTKTTQTPPAGYLEPDFGAAPPFKTKFSIGFNRTWDVGFSKCFEDQDCIDFRLEVQRDINTAFDGCPGFKNGSIVVFEFASVPLGVRVVSADQYADGTDGNTTLTYALYNASFDNEVIFSQGGEEVVSSYIESTVEVKLANNPLFISGSMESMDTDARDQMTALTDDPCPSIGNEICSAICYPCTSGDAYPSGVGCQPICREDQTCTIDQDNNIGCKCKENYLPVGDDCVDENLIIGLSAGIGGALLIGLLIAAIVLGCKFKKKDKQYDHLLESQGHRPDAYNVIGYENNERTVDNTNGAELNEKDGQREDGAIELATFSKADNDDDEPLSTAEAVVVVAAVAAEAAEEEAVDEKHHQQQQQHEVDVIQVEITDESHLGSNLEAVADYDNVSTASLSQHQPGTSKTEVDTNQSDYYRSLYYAMPDSSSKEQADPYNSFKPHLINIDANKEYVIKRPKLQPPNTSHYDYKSYF